MSFSPMENTCIADSNRLLKSGNTLLQSAMLSNTNTDISKFLFAAPYLLLTTDFVCLCMGVVVVACQQNLSMLLESSSLDPATDRRYCTHNTTRMQDSRPRMRIVPFLMSVLFAAATNCVHCFTHLI
jgi:hypothetical protein